MVLLSASVITKSGKALASRHFIEISRSRIEGLLAAFPRLIGKSAKQHTFVETDAVRYVYQPLLDKLYMVLITTKTSNILEDLEMLRLFAKVVAEYCNSLEESDVIASSLQLILAFDELVAMGYRENVTLAQIRTFVEMDSQEEKTAIAARMSQEREAKLKMKEKAKELQRQRLEAAKKGLVNRGGSAISSGGFNSSSFQSAPMAATSDATPKASYQAKAKPSASKGLKLGSKAKEWDQFANQLKQEGERVAPVNTSQTQAKSSTSPTESAQQTNREAVHLTSDEKITCRLQREGGLQSLEVHGMLTLRISEESAASVRILMEKKDPRNFQFNQHPNIDKELFRQAGCIGLKTAGKAFPVNADVGVLKWRLQSTDESLVPLTVNTWMNDNGNGGCEGNIEYELNQPQLQLTNVIITIPVHGGSPTVAECEGDYNFDARRNVLEWKIQLIDSDSPRGVLEFTANGRPEDFFPVGVQFSSSTPYSQIAVAGVMHSETKQPVKYSLEQSFVAEGEKYQII